MSDKTTRNSFDLDRYKGLTILKHVSSTIVYFWDGAKIFVVLWEFFGIVAIKSLKLYTIYREKVNVAICCLSLMLIQMFWLLLDGYLILQLIDKCGDALG